jgi:Replication initiator protein A
MGDDAERRIGRDEMNLSEYPLTLLADRAGAGVKTIAFGGERGQLTITGSDDYGLPTAADADVIVALIQLTKLANNFTDPAVKFVRSDVLAILGWPDDGRHYRRLAESLRRWVGVTLRWDQGWWDNAIKCKVDASFHILESVVIYDQEVRRTLRSRGQEPPPSSFRWNAIFFASCQANNLKRLNLGVYFALRSAVSKQVFRYLDKKFYARDSWAFDLREFALEHVGLSRNYTAAKLKQKLQPALEELEEIGFLEPMTALR